MELNDFLATRIKELRIQNDLTQIQLAKKAKVSLYTIRAVEIGKSSLTLTRLYKISLALNTLPNLIFRGYKELNKKSDKDN